MSRVHSLVVGLAVWAGGFLVQAEIVNVAPEATPAANAPLWGGRSIWQLNNGATWDTFHGDTALPAGFAYFLDLGQPYSIHELRLYPRQDGCCPDRLSNLRVSVHQDDGAGAIGVEVWGADLFTDGSNPGSAPGTVVKVTLPSAQTGRWVQIKSLADPVPNDALQMTELEVMAEVPAAEVNRALGTVVTANQPLYGSFDPANLVDVNRTTLVHGSTAINPGFAYTIHLGVTVTFSRILVYPRQDGMVPERLTNYRVSIHRDHQGQIGDEVWKADLHTDGSNAGAEPGTREVLTAELDPQGQFKGQWIRILSLDDPVADYALQIADVKAFGVPEGAATLLISKQPADATAGLGQIATFAVLATVAGGDSALLTYQWQENGVNIRDATNATYTTPPVVLEDAGKKYRCVLSYPGSASLPSDEARLRINLAYQALAYANQPIYGGWSIGQIVNGARGDIVHGAAILSPGFRYEVNLGAPFKLDEIDIFPRQDGCCPDRFSNVRVSVHNDSNGQIGDAVWSVDLFTDGSNAGSGPGVVVKLTADLDPTGKFEGPWVRLAALADPVPDYALQMSELEVYGRLVETPPLRLSISREAGAVVFTWQAGNLESAARVEGPWSPVTDARSPWSVAPTGGARFYRLRGQ